MAVPFGISILDVAKAIQVARDIYRNCFTEAQGANHKYRQFINDIQTLGNSLERLQDVIGRAEQQYPRREWHRDARRTEAPENLWPRLTGDFYQTLLECQSLLSRHNHLQNGRTKVSSNLRWWLSAEGAVDNLMARLRFHINKVEFYARPSEFDAVVRNGSQLQQLRRQMDKLERLIVNGAGPSPTLWSNIVSDDLRARFSAEFSTNGPSWCVKGSEWPLKEAFDALNFHFARGTIKFNPVSDRDKVPEMQLYLKLAKSIWILEEIKQSSHFKAVSNESIWADYMREFEDDLRGQVHRFDTGELDKPPAQQLLELPSDNYAISTSEETNSDPLDSGKVGPLEEKILEIELLSDSGNRESALSVFRENDTDFRLVTSTRQADTLLAQYDQEVEVNMDRNRLIPAYGNPIQSSSPRYNLILLNERGRKSKEFNFLYPEDIKELQRALTGYRVHHNMPVARWCIDGSRQPGDSGKGKLQLWQNKPLPPIIDPGPTGVSGGNSSVGNPISDEQHRDSVDFVDWKGFPNTPLTEKSDEQRSRTSSFAELKKVQVPNGKYSLTDAASPTSSGDREILKLGRSFSKASSLTAKSRNGSHESQKQSSVVSGTTQVSRSSMSRVQGSRSEGIEFSKPELPVLIIFTLCNGRYSFLHLTLDASIHVQPKACGCRNPKLRCKRVILESRNSSFTIRMLIADQEGEDDGLKDWDLSVFRYPQSEKLKSTTIIKTVQTLELEFADEDERKEFVGELTLLENLRTALQNDYQKDLRKMKKRAQS